MFMEPVMKLLKIRAEGLPLYRKTFDISFYAVQRVQERHCNSLHNLFENIHINTAEAFIGINASGKTTALQVISYAGMLLRAVPLNAGFVPKIPGEN